MVSAVTLASRRALGALAAGLILGGGVAWAQPWTGSWAAAQQRPEPQNALPAADLDGATLRQVVRLSIGGRRLRVRISNAFGAEPLVITGAHLALSTRAGAAATDPSTDRPLSFAGAPGATVPAGAEYWSDPVDLSVKAGTRLAVSLRLDGPAAGQTGHPGSRAVSFLAAGDHLADGDLPGARRVEHWYALSGVDVEAGPRAAAVAALGDSITDGHGATTDGDDRWPDDLARRLAGRSGAPPTGVLNVGIGGNRMLLDGLGPNAPARFTRDVLAQDGVRTVILLEGVNDMGVLTRDRPATPAEHAALVAGLILAYGQLIEAGHAHGVRMIGATVTPDGGSGYYHPDAANEADRQAVNRWIRARGHFDAVVDFDRAVRDDAHPDRLRPEYDSGDHLHPSPAGYRAMAEAVPLAALAP